MFLKMRTTLTSVFALLILQSTGCTSLSKSAANNPQMGNLLLAEPAPVSMRSQMALTRLDQLLGRVQQLSEEQKAVLFYQRGVLYDSVGLKGLAHHDFSRALTIKPDMAEAYNFIGIHHTQNMDFIQAYEAFDATLEIDPSHGYVFLNRGIALYYGGRPELAIEDLGTFYSQDDSDPYRAIWSFIAQQEVDPTTAMSTLQAQRPQLDDKQWATMLVDFYLGTLSENEVLDNLVVGVKNQRQLTDRLCEAYFYLGKFHKSMGHNGIASNYFKLALSTNVYEFVEHRYARLELNLLRERVAEDDQVK